MAIAPGLSGQSDEPGYLNQILQVGNQNSQYNTQNPYGSQTWSTDANGNRTLTQQYNPQVMQNYQSQLGSQGQAYGLFGQGAANLGQSLSSPFNTANAGASPIQYGAHPGMLMTGYNTSGFQAIPGAGDFQGNQRQVQNALYNQQAQYLDPQFAQSKAAMDSQLRNQGLTAGDAAYDTTQQNFNLGKNQAYNAAQNSAITGGQQASANLLAQALAIRGQQNQEGQQAYTDYNQAQNANFGQQATNVQLNNAANAQKVGQYAQNYTMPLAQYQTLFGALPQGSVLPGFGSPTTQAQNLAGVVSNQGYTNSSLGTLGSIIAGLNSAGGQGSTGGLVGQGASALMSWLNSAGSGLGSGAVSALENTPGALSGIESFLPTGGFGF